jgi:hypothetical protein
MWRRRLILGLLVITSSQGTTAELKFPLHRASGSYAHVAKRADNRAFLITVFDRTNTKLQEFYVESTLEARNAISVMDVDGDGYQDLVIAHGYGAGPFAHTSLYRFSVSSGQFKEDKSFPGEDFPTPAPRVGCIYLSSRLPPGPMYQYETTEWCLSRVDDHWTVRASCNHKHKCFRRLDGYMRSWHKKHPTIEPVVLQ